MNVLIILAEVSLIIFVFLLLNWVFSKLFKLFTKTFISESDNRSIKTLRRNITGLLLLACVVSCILIVGANGYLVYRGENLQQYTLLLIKRIPSGFWVTLGIGIAQSLGTLILAAIALKFLKYWLKVASTRTKNLEKNTADDESIDAFFNAFYDRISGGIWLWATILCAHFLKLPATVSEYLGVA
ncbi:hypothetical protein IQ277_23125 [Nostocales cyanobacterium LEGE 12452]|nr:hypothetical protein [Nostocales cyanobacterium LEGE 12452]